MAEISNIEKTNVQLEEDVVERVRPTSRLEAHNETYDISPEALGTNLPSNYYRSPKFLGTVFALSMGYMSTSAGWVLSSNVLSLIDSDVGPSKNISWVPLANTLGLAVTFILVGRLSDIFGRRWFMIGGNLFAVVGNIIAARANSVGPLILANAFNGIAGAVQISFSVAIAELVANKHRPLWVGGILFANAPVIGFGPIIADELAFNTKQSWRWCFWLGFIFAALSVIALLLCYFPPNFHMLHKRRSRLEQFKRIDFVGMVLYMAGLILLLMGLSWGGQTYPWKSAHVIATIVVGFFTTIAFVLYDNYIHRGDPLLPIYLIKSRGYIAMTLTAVVGSGVYYGMSILWPEEVDYLLSGSTVQNGFQQSVIGLGVVVGQGIGGLLVHRFRHHHRWILIGSTVSLTAFAAAMKVVEVGDKAKAIGLMLSACLAVGIIETASLSLAPLSCPPEDLGVALGTLGSIRSAGGSICTAIYITVLDNKLTSFTPKKVSAAALSAGLPESSLSQLLSDTTNTTGVPGINANITAAIAHAKDVAAAESFHYVWYAVTAFGVLSVFVASLTFENYDRFMTDEVSRKLQAPQQTMNADAEKQEAIE